MLAKRVSDSRFHPIRHRRKLKATGGHRDWVEEACHRADRLANVAPLLNWCLDEQVLCIQDGRLVACEETIATAEQPVESEEPT